ncbi:hypothetical protein ACIQ6V_15535 [Streptomyces sp. NPDC096198]|uniref:hypothetical protein n=1 Tax=Streptomyces sp. NPDC096198 TaxID=3366080 RepID=UPI003823D716
MDNLTRYPCPVSGCDSYLELTAPMYLDIWTDAEGTAYFTIAGNGAPTHFTCGAPRAHTLLDFPTNVVNHVMKKLDTADTAMYEEQYG